MKQEYIIINKESISKRIAELKSARESFSKSGLEIDYLDDMVFELNQFLSNSTPLIPEIEKAIQFGKDVKSDKAFINHNYGSPFIGYEDTTEETHEYISNFKLNI